ncbi:MAG: enoyl-CoA hydratase/isomerase family protein [Lautropia sp.]|nr:enoyl-CoA hydratase/isomerase family protein [Lautropia sp.]
MTEANVVIFDEPTTADGRRVGRATLNAPASLNALSLAMVEQLRPRLDQWIHDPDIVCIMLDGAGDRAFSAGGDIRDLYHSIRQYGPARNPYAQRFFSLEYALDYRIHTCPKPLICWGHGIVMGGGLGLLAGASHRVVTPETRIAMPEISIGLFPDVGGSWFLNRLPGRAGLFMALTGAPMNAADALFTGMADFCLDNDAKSTVFAEILASRWHNQAAANKAQMTHLLDRFETKATLAPSNLRRHFDLIRKTVGLGSLKDTAEHLLALPTNGDPWLETAVETFRRGSPTSAALSWELLQRCRHRSLADIFRIEYNVAISCCAAHDFAEGVRALLIDKDRKPAWKPPTLDALESSVIESHFRDHHEVHPLSDWR